ncbi:hypothetical protein [Mycoplasma sp. 613B]
MSLIKKVVKIVLLTTISTTSFISCNQIQKEQKVNIDKKMEIKEEKFEWKYDETKIKEKPVFYSNIVFDNYELQNNYFSSLEEFDDFLHLLKYELKNNEKYSNINSETNVNELVNSLQNQFPKKLFDDKFIVYITTPQFAKNNEKNYELVYHNNVNFEFYRLLNKRYLENLRSPEPTGWVEDKSINSKEKDTKIRSLILKNNISIEEKEKNEIMKFFIFDKKDVIFKNLKIYYSTATYNSDNSINEEKLNFEIPHYNSIFKQKIREVKREK